MNKLLVVLLAVCLVSVHAFVKRDAPAAGEQNTLEKFQKDFADKAKDFTDQLQKSFDPEKVKQTLNEFVEGFNKAMNSFKTTDTAAGGAA